MGSPTNADRTNQPDGGSALAVGCTRRPVRPALCRERKKRELEAVLVIEGAQVRCLALRSLRRTVTQARVQNDIDARTKQRFHEHIIKHNSVMPFHEASSVLSLQVKDPDTANQMQHTRAFEA